MKYLFLILPFVVLSCHPIEEWNGVRQIINETNQNLQIEVLAGHQWYQYEIAPQSELLLYGSCTSHMGRVDCYIGWLSSADSARILFNDERVLSYRSKEHYACEDRNIGVDPIWECHGYEPMEIGGDTIQYTYRITEADYQSAQPITE